MNYGVIDVGSNTVRLCVYDVSADGRKFKTIVNRKITAGLASYVENGALTEEGIQVAIDSVRRCLKRATYLNAARVDVFATAVLRNISNSEEAIAAVEKGAGCAVALLSDEDEAHLGFVGASHEDVLDNGVLVDIGGGSAEVTLVAAGRDVMRASLPIGSLSSYKKHVADILPTPEESASIRQDTAALLDAEPYGIVEHRVKKLFGVGGSIRAIAEANAHLREGATERDITRADAEALAADVTENRRAFIDAVLHTSPERLHTISCGLAVLLEIFERFDAQTLHVCENGVREGYLIERMLGMDAADGGSSTNRGKTMACKVSAGKSSSKATAKGAPHGLGAEEKPNSKSAVTKKSGEAKRR